MENLSRIVHYLILNSSSFPDIGLFNGKMGISLFFFHYAKFSREEIYVEFAKLLLDQVMDDLTTYTPVNFQDGLCRIGWGIEYLNRQKFIEVDTDEVLTELDRQIINLDIRRITDYSIATGLEGIMHYWISRCSNKNNVSFPFDTRYWNDLCHVLKEGRSAFSNPAWADMCLDYLSGNNKQTCMLSIPTIIRKHLIFNDLKEDTPLGLYNGLAGYGLNCILR